MTTSAIAPSAERPGDTATGVLQVPGHSLVVIAGLPGAGKTTLLRRLQAAGSPRVRRLDAEDVAVALGAVPLPYRALRPLIHSVHLLRVLATLTGPYDTVVTTDPMTSRRRRRVLHAVAGLAGRSVHVVLLDASEADAVRGQRQRGRALGRRRMQRHVRRWPQLRDVVAAGQTPDGASSAVVLTRARAASMRRIAVSDADLRHAARASSRESARTGHRAPCACPGRAR